MTNRLLKLLVVNTIRLKKNDIDWMLLGLDYYKKLYVFVDGQMNTSLLKVRVLLNR